MAERSLRIGATVFAIGILTFFAARSVNGGLAGVLLSALVASIAVSVALGVLTGAWRKARHVQPRHAVFGGCLTAVALCGTGGAVLCFGSDLLLGVLVGGAAGWLNHRQGWIDWRQTLGVDPGPPPLPAPAVVLSTPSARAAAIALAVALSLAGVFFFGQGAVRALETAAVAGDIGCTAPCGMQRGVWVQVVPDAQGNLVSQPAAGGLVEIRVSFHDDEPGERDVTSSEFTLSGPSAGAAYAASVGRAECNAWRMTLELDDAGKMALLCFSVGAGVDLSQLDLNWGTVVIPLGKTKPNFSLTLFA